MLFHLNAILTSFPLANSCLTISIVQLHNFYVQSHNFNVCGVQIKFTFCVVYFNVGNEAPTEQIPRFLS